MPNVGFSDGELRSVLFATEHDSNPASLRKFSYAGGESTYSFGLLQFDVGNRPAARKFLRENGFTHGDTDDLSNSGGLRAARLVELDTKLSAIPDAKLNEFTDSQLRNSVDRIDSLIEHLGRSNPPVASAIAHSKELQLALADYDNQFHIDGIGSRAQSNTMLAYLEGQPVRRNGETLQLTGTLARRDIQNYIDGTSYARAHPASVHNREQRLVGALSKMGVLGGTTWVADTRPSPQVLQSGARGDAITALQVELAQLGYTDAKGRPLAADGRFGPVTQAAVEAFQGDHGLGADGKVGRDTRGALDVALEDRQLAGARARRGSGAPPTPGNGDAARSAFGAADHPQRAMYERLQSLFPEGTSEARLCQAIAACRAAGIERPQQLASVIGADDTIFFGSHEPGGLMGQMDISRPAPAVEETLQQLHQFDQQQVQARMQSSPAPALDGP